MKKNKVLIFINKPNYYFAVIFAIITGTFTGAVFLVFLKIQVLITVLVLIPLILIPLSRNIYTTSVFFDEIIQEFHISPIYKYRCVSNINISEVLVISGMNGTSHYKIRYVQNNIKKKLMINMEDFIHRKDTLYIVNARLREKGDYFGLHCAPISVLLCQSFRSYCATFCKG